MHATILYYVFVHCKGTIQRDGFGLKWYQSIGSLNHEAQRFLADLPTPAHKRGPLSFHSLIVWPGIDPGYVRLPQTQK
jgi:hypothetical protein